MKKIYLIITIALSLIIINSQEVYATTNQNLTPSINSKYNSYDYVIDKYDINIIVNENNTLNITETITAYFNVPKHGIFRIIPLKNTITRLDGTTSTNRTQITNLSVDNEYTTSRENGNYKIKIGSADRSLTGEQKYTIKYTYNLGKDPMKDYDELYYNIIGNEWDTVIGNITFTITMPKEFNSSKLGFSSGLKGSTNNNKVNYTINKNTITGSYNDILNPYEALTIRCELPEGYFVGAKLDIDITNYIIICISVIFLILSIFLWLKFGHNNQVAETIEYYPPQGINSLEVGLLYKGKAEVQDVTSLLIYLANQGYIRINPYDEKSLYAGFKVTKLKEYDGNNINEKLFLKGLFKKRKPPKSLISLLFKKNINSKTTDNINEIISSDLHNNFYTTMNRILFNINNNNNKFFKKSASHMKIIIILMIIITYCLITILPMLNYEKFGNLLFVLVFPIIGFISFLKLTFCKSQTTFESEIDKPPYYSISQKIFGFIWGLGFCGFPWTFWLLPALKQNPIYLIEYGIGIICIIGMIITIINYSPKRTPYGNEILGKVIGFKNFLETGEKDKLETLIRQDSNYFYTILPYTYVLGISKKWLSKFETISLQSPSWYNNSNTFHSIPFDKFMDSTMASIQSTMTSNSSNSSSGSGSSGGSSGGGSGGGGGGSW